MKILFLLLFFSCKVLILKKDLADLPFKIKTGKYEINIPKLEYPKELNKKIDFFNSLYDSLRFIVTNNKKMSLALNETFIEDFIYIEKNGLLKEESFVSKTASDLEKNEKEILINFLNKEKRQYKSQELLNFQVEALYKILRREDLFESKRSYTELNKERALDNLRAIRNRITKIINGSTIELIIILSNPYIKNEYSVEYKKHYYSRNVSLFKNMGILNNFNRYKKYGIILFENIRDKDLNEILSSEVDLNLDYYIIKNNYSGYKYLTNGRMIFFEGGDQYFSSSKAYEIRINIKEANVNEIKDLSLSYTIKDLFVKEKESLSNK